jgi:hypothetical protein
MISDYPARGLILSIARQGNHIKRTEEQENRFYCPSGHSFLFH